MIRAVEKTVFTVWTRSPAGVKIYKYVYRTAKKWYS